MRKQLQTQRHQKKLEKKPAAVVEIIEDEFCEDHEYNSNVDESATEDLIEKVLVEPEGAMHFYEETLEEKLEHVGIKPLLIKVMKNEKGVKIEKRKLEKPCFLSGFMDGRWRLPRLILPPLPYLGWKFKLPILYNYTIFCL